MKQFIQRSSIFFLLLLFAIHSSSAQEMDQQISEQEVREYYVSSIVKIADPVLQALSRDELRKKMPVEKSPGAWDDRTHVTYLEAFGRLLSGMAPWLELGPDNTPEGKLRAKYIKLAQQGIKNATDPESADFMNFKEDGQPLVDAAFLAQGLLRAPNQLWEPLDEATKKNVVEALKSSRQITPPYTNWLLFTGMVEAALLKFDDSADFVRLEYPLNKHMEWYLGDGMYGDGPDFHWDYYNSYVIQPMLLDILKTMEEKEVGRNRDFKKALGRARRYAEIQERLISPEGTYPAIGRSLAYRFGAFQLLSQIALWEELPENIEPAQVRSALYTVIKNQLEAEGTFDEDGWLQIGFYGHQPSIGEGYISTGSLYLCSEAFLVLGLEPDAPFWANPPKPWTQKKIWDGMPIPIDHAYNDYQLDRYPELPDSKEEVAEIIHKVNEHWQEKNPEHGWSFWHDAAYHTGNIEAYKVTGKEEYLEYSKEWAEENEWMGAKSQDKSEWKRTYGETDEHVLFGDWQIAFQTYIDIYNLEGQQDPEKIARAREVMEYQMSTDRNDYWFWADGLYMVMPVMTKLYSVTGNKQYLEKLDDYLSYADSIMYDEEAHLYYRDAKYVYPEHKSENEKKDFWSRGNGWVFAGFAKVLQDFPEDAPKRDWYEDRFRAMADALADAQQDEGYWTRSLLDAKHAPGPETSGTAFFTYGFLWGINNGVLDKDKYLPIVKKSWDYLTEVALQEDGAVGYVQPIGEKAIPGQVVDKNSTADFGVGAFLLAASEMYRLVEEE